MKIHINIDSNKVHRDFADVVLSCNETKTSGTLDLDLRLLRGRLNEPSDVVLDFLLISLIVYSADKLISKSQSSDNWTRDFKIKIPVSDTARWRPVKSLLQESLNFLTGDYWDISFVRLNATSKLIPNIKRQGDLNESINSVCLFSGGLDSLIGAIDWLESQNENILLVSHYDGKVPGPKSDQTALLNILKPYYGERIKSVQVRAGINAISPEKTFRSRSLLFIALGIYAASSIDSKTPILIPENGTIAINVPLTPSRRGSCSTRTAHPYYLNLIKSILSELGISNLIINPLAFKTKGECVEECLNQDLLRDTALHSVSCAKRGHTFSWKNRSASGCGFCMPCIYRRAALHKIGMDTEIYGLDICKGDVDLKASGDVANDFRACLFFTKKNYSKEEIAALILANSTLDMNVVMKYADLIQRSVTEIKDLLSEKYPELDISNL